MSDIREASIEPGATLQGRAVTLFATLAKWKQCGRGSRSGEGT